MLSCTTSFSLYLDEFTLGECCLYETHVGSKDVAISPAKLCINFELDGRPC